MTATSHDVVIVGGGVAGSLIAKRLSHAGLKVLMLEAGPESTRSFADYNAHLDRFYAASAKGAESPWPPAVGAPQPDGGDIGTGKGYFVQRGPNQYGSTYTRTLGGSTLHWLGVSLRMLPEDFELQTRCGVGLDWPIGYSTLSPYYDQAEHEMGVSADVAQQQYHGLSFTPGYDYPMRHIPQSYSDRVLAAAVDGTRIALGDTSVAVRVRPYPAARNSIPRHSYQPRGAIDLDRRGNPYLLTIGERCEGNTACTPICPVQAKYHAGKTLVEADWRHLELRTRAVASRVLVDPASGEVQGIRYQRYERPDAPNFVEQTATGRYYVLAAHAVENARLLLASDLPGRSGLVGRHLMDHPALYAWGRSPLAVGPFRGPQSSSGIEEFRAGAFRAQHAAFRFDIGNDGWRATTGAPDTTVAQAVLQQGLIGQSLRHRLREQLGNQVRFSLAVEQLADATNRVSIDPAYRDAFGNPRPVIDYRITDYTLAGMAAALQVARQIFARAGITDCTGQDELSFPTVNYQGRNFAYHGMGHFAGTHLMGADPRQSVVDSHQRSWDHRNLYLAGAGSFPSMGTSNPTLTLAALALRIADDLIAQFPNAAGAAAQCGGL
nr:GMC family oxidoreductase [uncultured Rhodopila sp.]